jgi:endoglucanase
MPMPKPTTRASKRRDLRLTRKVTSDWGAGYCETVKVTNRTRHRLAWHTTIDVHANGTLDSLWGADGSRHGTKLEAHGPAYAPNLAPHASTTFGFCVTR